MSSELAISANHVSKIYQLGLTGRSSSLATILRQRLRQPFRAGPGRDSFRALDDVSFDVRRGEVVGVVGKNGAGKSTLLKILSRITTPSEGHIDIAGSVGSLLEVGTGFHPELTGLENVYLNGTILGMSRQAIDQRLDEIVAFAEIDRFLGTPVKRYSSGMRVRLAFAVAAHLEPEIMIIDEVLSVGDHNFQLKCLEKMRSIAADDGRTVLYVSHNLVSVEHLCPRALLLAGGQLVFDGPTDETLARYLGASARGTGIGAAGSFDLTTVERQGRGDQKLFTRVELRPGGGPLADMVRMGDRLRIEVSVQGLDQVPEAVMLFSVGSSTNSVLFRMSSRMIAPTIAHERCPNETFVLDVPSLPLTPGDYHLDLAAYHGPEHTWLDEINRAAYFTVVGGDVLGTGYQFAPRDGAVVVPFEWELRPAREPETDVTRG